MAIALSHLNGDCIKVRLASGAASNTTFAVTGIDIGDVIIDDVLDFDGAARTLTGVLDASNFTITAADTVQSSVATDGKSLVITFIDISGGSEA